MTNEEVFDTIKEMFFAPTYTIVKRAGKKLKDNNVEIRDLNTKLVIYNNGNRIIVPTIVCELQLPDIIFLFLEGQVPEKLHFLMRYPHLYHQMKE